MYLYIYIKKHKGHVIDGWYASQPVRNPGVESPCGRRWIGTNSRMPLTSFVTDSSAPVAHATSNRTGTSSLPEWKNLSPPNYRAPDIIYPGSPLRSRNSSERRGGFTTRPRRVEAFKEIQNQTRDALRAAHWDYINQMLKKGLEEGKSEQFWSYLEAQSQDSQGVAPLKEGNQLLSDALSKH